MKQTYLVAISAINKLQILQQRKRMRSLLHLSGVNGIYHNRGLAYSLLFYKITNIAHNPIIFITIRQGCSCRYLWSNAVYWICLELSQYYTMVIVIRLHESVDNPLAFDSFHITLCGLCTLDILPYSLVLNTAD